MANPIKNPHQQGHDDGGHGEAENPEVAFERKDINIVQITGFGIGLLIAFMLSVVAMWGLFEYFMQRENNLNPATPHMMTSNAPALPPQPRLQPEPVKELKDMHENEEMLLNNYYWVDPAKGTVHIPIDQAIDVVAQKGLPVKVTPAGADNDGYRMMPSDASGGRTLEKISQ